MILVTSSTNFCRHHALTQIRIFDNFELAPPATGNSFGANTKEIVFSESTLGPYQQHAGGLLS
jgi:hypothetical protein